MDSNILHLSPKAVAAFIVLYVKNNLIHFAHITDKTSQGNFGSYQVNLLEHHYYPVVEVTPLDPSVAFCNLGLSSITRMTAYSSWLDAAKALVEATYKDAGIPSPGGKISVQSFKELIHSIDPYIWGVMNSQEAEGTQMHLPDIDTLHACFDSVVKKKMGKSHESEILETWMSLSYYCATHILNNPLFYGLS